VPNQLPARIPHFVGRRDEMDALTRLLDEAVPDDGTTTVLAVDGPGGVGKTALAVRWASEIADRFPGGQLYVNLRGFDPSGAPMVPADVIRGFLDALSVPAEQIPAGVAAQAQLYRSLLAGTRMLVLLDNARDADQVRPLLPGARGTAVLITSRRRLVDLEEAVPLTLGTLPAGEAEQLFIRLDPASAREPEAVSEVVRRCGCLPLAVRLLAGRLRHHPSWTVTDLIGALAETQNELEEIHAGSLTMAAAFELSYADIPADQQRMFRGLGLHPGQDIDARAAAALDSFDLAGTRRLLDELYDNHLIEETARGRYGLHDLLRAYARTLAAADEAADRAARTGRLLGYYLAAAQAADRHLALHADAAAPDGDPSGIVPKLATWDQALAWMQAERLNLQACVEFAAATGRPAEAAGIAAAMGTFLYDAGYWDQALAIHRVAAVAAATAGDPAGQARALINLGAAQRLTDDYPAAIGTLTRALGLAQETGDQRSQAQALINLGAAQYMTDDSPAATHAYRDALEKFRGLGDRPGQAIALCYLGGVQYESGDYPAAAGTLAQALTLYRDLGDRLGQMNTLLWTGALQRVTGDYLAATGSLSRALELSRSLGNRLGEANALHYLGAVRGATGDHAAAASDLLLALDLFRGLGDRQGEANALCYLGDVQVQAGEYDAAAGSLTRALRESRQVGDRLAQAEALTGLGRLYLASAGPDQASASFTEALDVATALQSPLHQARALDGIGHCLARNGDVAAATGNLRQALEIYRRLRVPEAAEVTAALASLHSHDLSVAPVSRSGGMIAGDEWRTQTDGARSGHGGGGGPAGTGSLGERSWRPHLRDRRGRRPVLREVDAGDQRHRPGCRGGPAGLGRVLHRGAAGDRPGRRRGRVVDRHHRAARPERGHGQVAGRARHGGGRDRRGPARDARHHAGAGLPVLVGRRGPARRGTPPRRRRAPRPRWLASGAPGARGEPGARPARRHPGRRPAGRLPR
jgi:tetratricopeptide (TPR) repeat protein